MNVAVIGLGYWGPNLVRNFLAMPGVEKVWACDIDKNRLQSIKLRFPSVEVTDDVKFLATSSQVDAFVIATPVASHYSLAREALENGKHVLLEKPMTASTREAEELVELSKRKNLTLMVDHTFIFTGAVRKIKELIDLGRIGTVSYFDSVRVNLGLFQHDVNVVWDLAAHDLSIMDYLVAQKPVSVSAHGISHYNGSEDVAYVTVKFDRGLIAHFHVNWLAPVKIRRILIGGSKQMIVYDDLEPTEKVKVYDKGVDVVSGEGVYRALIEYRTGDMYAPKLDITEALSSLCSHFMDCIVSGETPLTSGEMGLNVVRILEAAEKSMRNDGVLVKLLREV